MTVNYREGGNVVKTISLLPEYQETYLKDLLASAQALPTVEQPEIQVAGMTPAQQQAIQLGIGGIGAYQPMLQAGAESVGKGLEALSPEGYKRFENQYIEDVLNRNLADVQRQADIESNRLAAQAQRAGAFGGSRAAIADATMRGGLADRFARQSADLRAKAFESAMDKAQDASELFTKVGLAQAGLGEAAQGLQAQDINQLLGLGGIEQAQAQAELDALYQTDQQRRFAPFQRIGFLSDIFRGVPTTQSTIASTTMAPPSRLTQLAGLGTGIAGLAKEGAFGQGGIFSGLGGLFGGRS